MVVLIFELKTVEEIFLQIWYKIIWYKYFIEIMPIQQKYYPYLHLQLVIISCMNKFAIG